AGEYILSAKVWLDQGRALDKFYLCLTDPEVVIPISLEGVERRKWVRLEKKFSKLANSSTKDQFRIEIRKEDLPKIRPTKLYLDEIEIRPARK
ncbi:MAG: glycoside hydrolase, partial [Bacteroidota bacterium]